MSEDERVPSVSSVPRVLGNTEAGTDRWKRGVGNEFKIDKTTGEVVIVQPSWSTTSEYLFGNRKKKR